jgi:ATP-dependent helicase HrpB
VPRASLPVDAILPAIVASLRGGRNVVVTSPPGSGKTTRIPAAMLEAGIAARGAIIVLEPRRLAARLAAKRVAEELGEVLGKTVGYQVRFESVGGAETRIRFVTEGVLTRRLLEDPHLEGVAAILADEAHERNLEGDTALALARHAQLTARPDLRLGVLSATIAADRFAAWCDGDVHASDGRLHPVALRFSGPDDRPLDARVLSALHELYTEGLAGHTLVFLPGAAEIRRCIERGEKLAERFDLELVGLHGAMAPEEQDEAVFGRTRKRRVIFATNVAESSITIEGVAAVVDSGLERKAKRHPTMGTTELVLAPIARASADQRTGRAGRTGPGVCVRLWTKAEDDRRAPTATPDVETADLAPLVLALAAYGRHDLPWLDAPSDKRLGEARTLLERLGLLDSDGRPTDDARRAAAWPVHPRAARIALTAESLGVARSGALAAILATEGGLARRAFSAGRGPRDTATVDSDLDADLAALEELAELKGIEREARHRGLDASRVREVLRTAERLGRDFARDREAASHERLARALLSGHPDRVAQRIDGASTTLRLVDGGRARLGEESAVRNAPVLLVHEAIERAGETVVTRATGVDAAELLSLDESRLAERAEPLWNERAERVDVRTRMTFGALVLDESVGAPRDEDEAALTLLVERALAAGLFDAKDALERLRVRVAYATGGEAPSREAVVRTLARGARAFDELRALRLPDAWLHRADSDLRRALDQHAPETFTLPTGKSASIQYAFGKAPFVEVYLQDLFGRDEGPRVGVAREPIVLHLTAPSGRPVQVTSDLAGFWDRHYPGIRKELMRKYPRHQWPEDPRTAPPGRFAHRGRPG